MNREMTLTLRKNAIISEVENMCEGSSDSVLPALFFQDVQTLDFEKVLLLEIMIDMYRIGRAVHKK